MRRRLLLSFSGALGLSACGFRLRGAPNLAFRSLYLVADTRGTLVDEIRRNLVSNEGLELITDPARKGTAQAVLDILSETRGKSVVGVSVAGQVREFQLRLKVRFKLTTPQGVELIPPSELVQQRDITFNETAVLAKEAEESLLYRNMQTDIVQQLMRRLETVQMP